MKGSPSAAALRMNISGSINAEEIQKAITGASGTPTSSSPATMGMTPHEQKGNRLPNKAAAIIAAGRPEKTPAISFSDPVARVAAATATDSSIKGEK